MTWRHFSLQQDLFEFDKPPIVISSEQKNRLLSLVQAMLIEITAPSKSQTEDGDDEDHA